MWTILLCNHAYFQANKNISLHQRCHILLKRRWYYMMTYITLCMYATE